MAETNAELPGQLPGQFPTTPGEADPHDYIRDTGPFKGNPSGGGDTDPHDYVRDTGPFKGGQAPAAAQPDTGVKDTKPTTIEDIEAHYARDRASGGAVNTVGAGAGYPLARNDAEATDSTGRPLTADGGTQSNDDDRGKDVGAGAVKEVESHFARDAAAVGAVTAVGAGAGYAAVESQRRQSEALPDDGQEHGAYDRAGKGITATEPELEKKFATYDLNDPNPEKTEEMKEQIRKIEEEKVAAVGVTEQPQKKGLLQKLGLSKDKNQTSTSTSTGSTERRRSSVAAEPEPGHIVIAKEGSDPTAPTLVVREHPDNM